MAESNFNGIVDSLMKGMETLISSKTVLGDPTKIEDTIILPLMDVTFGVGVGAGAGDRKNGGAGAMSGKMTPSAVLVIKNGQTKLVNIKNQDTLTKILDMVPDVIEKFKPVKEEFMEDEEAVDIAFPEGTEE